MRLRPWSLAVLGCLGAGCLGHTSIANAIVDPLGEAAFGAAAARATAGVRWSARLLDERDAIRVADDLATVPAR
jgi:hypothetical protein